MFVFSVSVINCLEFQDNENLEAAYIRGELNCHHGASNRRIFREAAVQRLRVELGSGSLIMLVGGNTMAIDGLYFMHKCSNCQIHIYEPIAEFYDQLVHNWKSIPDLETRNYHIHNVGLGATTRTVILSTSDLDGEGTFAMNSSGTEPHSHSVTEVSIIRAKSTLESVLMETSSGMLDLLHVNCEGCEYELLEDLIQNNLHRKIRIIQFGGHYHPAVPRLTERYCWIREQLEESHRMVYGHPFAWERWDLIS